MALLITRNNSHYEGIICHENYGKLIDLLEEYYTDEQTVRKLFDMGEIVYLHSDFGKEHHSEKYQYDMDLIAKHNMWSTFKFRDHHKNGTIYKGVSLVDVIIESNQTEVFLFENLTWKHLTGI